LDFKIGRNFHKLKGFRLQKKNPPVPYIVLNRKVPYQFLFILENYLPQRTIEIIAILSNIYFILFINRIKKETEIKMTAINI
jgi:hypothetical protein